MKKPSHSKIQFFKKRSDVKSPILATFTIERPKTITDFMHGWLTYIQSVTANETPKGPANCKGVPSIIDGKLCIKLSPRYSKGRIFSKKKIKEAFWYVPWKLEWADNETTRSHTAESLILNQTFTFDELGVEV